MRCTGRHPYKKDCKVAPHSNTFHKMAMPLGSPHNLNAVRQIHQLAEKDSDPVLGRETILDLS